MFPWKRARLKTLRCPSARSTDGSKIAFATGPAARSSCVPLVPSCLSSVSYGTYKTTSKSLTKQPRSFSWTVC
ncbi:hypothetical protein V5799_014162 [Amblyomma americanum]|uniref:Uncharacterized protein n=1 Tax=Amblyomma americanum TaxID=6943 RepID=A0AAQ4E3U6_AMBAM